MAGGVMQMNQVRYFLALCEERNFTCGVAQPSLTKAIKRLERTLGGPLFHRDRKNIEVTELGRVVKPYLKQINQCAYEAKRKAGVVGHAPAWRGRKRNGLGDHATKAS
jgi:LysR family transcriptional regulator, hydrogen peroxide-inducible genes activator